MAMHVKWSVHMSMLLVLIGTVTCSRPSPGIVLGKSVGTTCFRMGITEMLSTNQNELTQNTGKRLDVSESSSLSSKYQDFRLNKNWRPQVTRPRGSKSIINKETTDDEDLIMEGSGSGTLAKDVHENQNRLHSIEGTHMSCCSVGYVFGKNGIHCNAELHYNKLVTSPVRNGGEYWRRLKAHLKRHGVSHLPQMVFQRCFERRPSEFHKCCYVAKKEKDLTSRWRKHNRKKFLGDKRYISWRFIKG